MMRWLVLSLLLMGTPSLAFWGGETPEKLEAELQKIIAEQCEYCKPANKKRRELAELYESLNLPAKAVPHYRDMLVGMQRKLGPTHKKTMTIKGRLGVALRMAGYFDEAQQVLEEVYQHYLENAGSDDWATLKMQLHLGRVYSKTMKVNKARKLLESLLETSRRKFGDSHNWTSLAKLYLADVLKEQGQVDRAETLLLEAEAQLRNSPKRAGEGSKQHTMAVKTLAELYIMQGRMDEAERLLQQAFANLTERLGKEHPLATDLSRKLANLYADQGRYSEAERLLQPVVDARRQYLGTDSAKTVIAVLNLSEAQQGLGKTEQAEQQMRALLDNGALTKDSSRALRAKVQLQLGDLLLQTDRWSEAEALFSDVLQIRASHHSMRPARAHQGLGEIRLRQQQYRQALGHLQQALEMTVSIRGEGHVSVAHIRANLAEALFGLGQLGDAAGEYRRAIEQLTDAVNRSATQSLRARAQQEQVIQKALRGYMKLLLAAYEKKQALDVEPLSAAFTIAESARGRAVQQALLGMGARAAAGNPRLAEQVRREQDMKMQLGLLEEQVIELMGSPEADKYRDQLQDLADRRKDLERDIHRLNETIHKDFPAYGRLMNPAPATIAAVQQHLQPGEVMLSWLVEEDQTLLWAISAQQVQMHRLPLGATALAGKVRRLRRSLDVPVATLADVPPYDVNTAHELYQQLMAPAQALLKGARHLILVPHAALMSLPFGALLTEKSRPNMGGVPFSGYRGLPWLARRHAISVLPSATVFVTLREVAEKARAKYPFVGFGDPAFGGQAASTDGVTQRGVAVVQRAAVNTADIKQLPPLPETADELKNIASVLGADPQRDLFLGRKATEKTVKSSPLQDYRVVAFATHGLISGDLAGLDEPALALTPPDKASNDNDGLLKMSEVLGLKMDADWVVLSACNTAAADGSLQGQGLSGLARAFFYAGSRAMLVTLWPVETTSAQALTTTLFEVNGSQQGMGRAAALAAARKRMIEGPGFMQDGQEVFAYAHPMFWAAFIIVGEGAL